MLNRKLGSSIFLTICACFCFSSIAAISNTIDLAETKNDKKNPQDAYNRLKWEFADFYNSCEENVYVAEDGSDVSYLAGWFYMFSSVETNVSLSYKQVISVQERGNYETRLDTGEYVKMTKTDELLTYEYQTAAEPDRKMLGETTEFNYLRDTVQTTCYELSDSGQQDSIISIIDAVNGDQFMYMQKITRSEGSSETEKQFVGCRIMIKEGVIYASKANLTEEEALSSRINSVYKNYDAFMFKGGETFVFKTNSIMINTEDGRSSTFTPTAEAS